MTLVCLGLTTLLHQLVRDFDIIGGDEKKVGYYAGLIVSDLFSCTVDIGLPARPDIRNQYSSPRRHCVSSTGPGYLITSVASLSFSSGSEDVAFPCYVSASLGLS